MTVSMGEMVFEFSLEFLDGGGHLGNIFVGFLLLLHLGAVRAVGTHVNQPLGVDVGLREGGGLGAAPRIGEDERNALDGLAKAHLIAQHRAAPRIACAAGSRGRAGRASAAVAAEARVAAARARSSLRVWRTGERVIVETAARSFLHNQVRNMVGTLVEVGAGRQSVAWVKDVLEAKNRQVSGPKAPACGLYFLRANYPEKYRWSSDA